MTTYTIYNNTDSSDRRHGLSLEDAAAARLNQGRAWEIRPEGDGWWTLFVKNALGQMTECYSGPSPHGQIIMVKAATKDEAWSLMAPIVAHADWDDNVSVVTDDEYSQMMQDVA